jgi:hypothetical protein
MGLDNYFAEKYQSPAAQDFFQTMLKGIQYSNAPLRGDTNTLITIPVRANEPDDFPISTAAIYANQRLSSKFALFFHVNAMTQSEIDGSSALHGVYEAMDTFGNNYPIICSTAAYGDFGFHKTIGRVRRDVASVALHVANAADINLNDDCTLFTNDVDSVNIPQNYLSTVALSFKYNKRIKAQSGPCIYPERVKNDTPLLWIYNNLALEMGWINYVKTGFVRLFGANTAVRANEYIEFGGHDPRQRIGENATLNTRLLEKHGRGHVRYEPGMKVVTDPRRYEAALRCGIPLADAHATFGGKNDLARYYSRSHYIQPCDWINDLEPQLQRFCDSQLESAGASDSAARRTHVIERLLIALSQVGIQSSFLGTQLEIHNLEEVYKTYLC